MGEDVIRQPLSGPLKVVNLGLEGFARDLESHGVEVVQVNWSPPAGGDPKRADPLSRLDTDIVEQANREALGRMLAGDPVLVDVIPAGAAIPALGAQMVLHAGPPIDWRRMCGPLRGAIAGVAVFEGWAPDLDAAEAMAAQGAFDFRPNHDFDAVGPMTGLTTLGQPVMVVENRAFGNRAYCTINEGLGKVMRFGGNDAEVLARVAWLRDDFGPMMGAALRGDGPAIAPAVNRVAKIGHSSGWDTLAGIVTVLAARRIGCRD